MQALARLAVERQKLLTGNPVPALAVVCGADLQVCGSPSLGKAADHQRDTEGVILEPEEVAAVSEPVLTLGSCCLAKSQNAALVQGALLHFHGPRYFLHAWCVMPNHAHVVVTPHPPHDPSTILKSWKGFTARRINAASGVAGALWEQESFDHLCRRADHVERFIAYTLQNPVQAGLCKHWQDWPWSGRNC